MPRKRKFELGHGSFGNGITVFNTAREVFEDYEKVAHIDRDRKILYSIPVVPVEVVAYVENIAKNTNPSMSVSQPEQKVFNDPV